MSANKQASLMFLDFWYGFQFLYFQLTRSSRHVRGKAHSSTTMAVPRTPDYRDAVLIKLGRCVHLGRTATQSQTVKISPRQRAVPQHFSLTISLKCLREAGDCACTQAINKRTALSRHDASWMEQVDDTDVGKSGTPTSTLSSSPL